MCADEIFHVSLKLKLIKNLHVVLLIFPQSALKTVFFNLKMYNFFKKFMFVTFKVTISKQCLLYDIWPYETS